MSSCQRCSRWRRGTRWPVICEQIRCAYQTGWQGALVVSGYGLVVKRRRCEPKKNRRGAASSACSTAIALRSRTKARMRIGRLFANAGPTSRAGRFLRCNADPETAGQFRGRTPAAPPASGGPGITQACAPTRSTPGKTLSSRDSTCNTDRMRQPANISRTSRYSPCWYQSDPSTNL